MLLFFFFSSRRRHTRWPRDWSSDVCSSDLVQDRRLNDIPDAFAGNRHAQAYFGVFKKVLPEALAVLDQQIQAKWLQLAFETDQSVESSVEGNSINPQHIEADIRKQRQPRLFQECKGRDGGPAQAT